MKKVVLFILIFLMAIMYFSALSAAIVHGSIIDNMAFKITPGGSIPAGGSKVSFTFCGRIDIVGEYHFKPKSKTFINLTTTYNYLPIQAENSTSAIFLSTVLGMKL